MLFCCLHRLPSLCVCCCLHWLPSLSVCCCLASPSNCWVYIHTNCCTIMVGFTGSLVINKVLYENIDQILLNKSHGPMHYKIGVTCIYHGHVFFTLVITLQSNPPISQFISPCNEFTSVWSMCVYNKSL